MSCIFCAIIKGKAPANIIFQDEKIIVFLALEGHPLVVPKKHIEHLSELDDDYSAIMMQTAVKVSSALRESTGCEGINLVLSDGRAAGQDVFHIHLHVKPRWQNDNIVLSWDIEKLPDDMRAELASSLRSKLFT